MPLVNTNIDEDLERNILNAWEDIDNISPDTQGKYRDAILQAMELLDAGEIRVAEKVSGKWTIHTWLKKAILLYFRIQPMRQIEGGIDNSMWWDKIPNKFNQWGNEEFQKNGFRSVPNCVVRYSAYIGKNAVLMPCFINVGARVGARTMIDTWSTVGSCAQVGENCHISGGVGVGGVIEPLQASPVIIEDNVFIGARSEIVEGVIIEEGAVLSMGVFISASTKIINRETGEIHRGRVPAYSVVVPGTLAGKCLPDGSQGPSLACAVIVKQVDKQTRSKTSVNELLRD